MAWRYLVALCVYAFAQVEWRAFGLVAADTLFFTGVAALHSAQRLRMSRWCADASGHSAHFLKGMSIMYSALVRLIIVADLYVCTGAQVSKLAQQLVKCMGFLVDCCQPLHTPPTLPSR